MIILKKLNRIFDRQTKFKFAILFIAIMLGGLIEMFALALTYPVIELLLSSVQPEEHSYVRFINSLFNFSSKTSLLAFLALSLAVIYIAKSVYIFVLNYVRIRFLGRKQAYYSKKLLSKILNFSYLYHTHKNVAEVQRIISEDVAHLFTMLTAVISFLTDFFMTVFMIAYLFYESPLLTACVLGLALFCIFLYFMFFRESLRKAGSDARNAKISMNKAIFQIIGGIKEVKVSKRESHFEGIFSKARDRYVRTYNKYQIINLIPKCSLDIVFFGGSFTFLALFISRDADISAIVPQLALFVLAAFKIMPAITKQVGEVSTIIYNKASVDAVYANLYEEKDIAAEISIPDETLLAARFETNDIIIHDVTFAYPSIGENVLENVSFTIPENKSVALVGTTGAGKSTLADLILGILTPNTGAVFYKGEPIYNNEAWNKNLGYIPQHIYLLDESILANVAFGIPKKDIDEEKVRRALQQAQLLEFAESLPDGIHTMVGDRGVRLSGGQRQRVGIARALYEDPPFLVLDEATSSLDTETEAAVMDAIIGFHGNKTVLIIAHRLSTIEHCDIVYRVENKTVTRER